MPSFGRYSAGLTNQPLPESAFMRKSISKKTRFEVFKRDGFTCQYCGAHPPSVILHVDHIMPVSKGGANHIDNYITSCEPCNLGKSANLLTDVPQSLKDKAAAVAERELQIAGYEKIMRAKRLRIDDESQEVREVYEVYCDGYTLTDTAMVTVRKFIESIGLHAVRDAMEQAFTRPTVRKGYEFKYFCGICWNIIKGDDRGAR